MSSKTITMKKILILALLILSSKLVHAALQDEIQVYTDDINSPGEWGVELHINTTPRGLRQTSYAGEVVNHHGLRLTPEVSYALTHSLELGLYIPMVRTSDANWTVAGSKLRLKWLPLQAQEEGGFFGGVNFELSQVKPQFAQSAKSLEMRNIFGWKNNEWLLAINPIFGWDLSPGFQHHSPDFTVATKISRSFSQAVAMGFEYYNGIGQLNQSLQSNIQEKMLFAVLDYEGKPMHFNFGIGKGLTKATDPWTIKGILEIPF